VGRVITRTVCRWSKKTKDSPLDETPKTATHSSAPSILFMRKTNECPIMIILAFFGMLTSDILPS